MCVCVFDPFSTFHVDVLFLVMYTTQLTITIHNYCCYVSKCLLHVLIIKAMILIYILHACGMLCKNCTGALL